MPNPITLRNLGGRSAAPAALTASTLVLIDCQNTYREGVMALSGVEAALDEIAALLARARRLGVPVIHIQHDAGPGSPYDVSAPIGAIADKVAPAAGEPVVLKHFPNSFIGTDLEARLKATGRQNVVFVGFMTHMCVNSTTRGAFNLGFAPTVVASATATRDLPDPHGNVVPAATLQAASLAALGDRCAVGVPDAAALPDA